MSNKKSVKKNEATESSVPWEHLKTDDDEKTINEEIPIAKIENYSVIPDYKHPTTLKSPYVVSINGKITCIEGWGLVQGGREKGDEHIMCTVKYVSELTDPEFALMKTAMRLSSVGGRTDFIERVRNVNLCCRLLATPENTFSHGGDRSSPNYQGLNGHDFISHLSDRLCKSRKTIRNYLYYGRHLNAEAFEKLDKLGAKKRFFEEVNKNKITLAGDVAERGLSAEDTDDQVSRQVIKWLREYKRGKTITYPTDVSLENETDEEADEPITNNLGNIEDDTITMGLLKGKFKDLANYLRTGCSAKDLDEMKQIAQEGIAGLTEVLQKIDALNQREVANG